MRKIKLDNFNKEQLDLILKAYKGDKESKNTIEYWAGEIICEQIRHQKCDVFQCNDLPVDKLEFTAKVEIPITIINKKFKKSVNKV